MIVKLRVLLQAEVWGRQLTVQCSLGRIFAHQGHSEAECISLVMLAVGDRVQIHGNVSPPASQAAGKANISSKILHVGWMLPSLAFQTLVVLDVFFNDL